ncbi:FadR/GntR family transcriptional regulator [Sphingomonas xinjiangensis]|uniref:DNA-binding FadR family transcriptional regulator n=1 Tax=Sphingomonas xinjiangensis TaxID=643568 RepID=A0A840YQN9_9SPHN|nr:FadR/GntR family transcriptional regulator [Sphingomonas xinjiangensis]MBB5710703.1 DNA-binding FadR family transcriptional regulator [Sphingomonas xinjiangensis]
MAVTKAASLADDLVRRIEAQIESGAMPPGARFPTEKAVTEDLGVSRTVVREAFARLAARGLLVSRRGSGAYVADDARYRAFQVTAAEVAEIGDLLMLLEMRRGFEVEMAELAATRRTDADLAAIRETLEAMEGSTDVDTSLAADARFHAALAQATGNPHFVRFTQFLGVRLVPSRTLYLQDSDPKAHQRHARRINADHKAIYAAIEARNAAAAGRAARRHIDKSIARYRDRIPG